MYQWNLLFKKHSRDILCHCSTHLKDFDPFGMQKETSFLEWLPQISTLASYVTRLINKPNQSQAELRVEFEHLLLVSEQ